MKKKIYLKILAGYFLLVLFVSFFKYVGDSLGFDTQSSPFVLSALLVAGVIFLPLCHKFGKSLPIEFSFLKRIFIFVLPTVWCFGIITFLAKWYYQ